MIHRAEFRHEDIHDPGDRVPRTAVTAATDAGAAGMDRDRQWRVGADLGQRHRMRDRRRTGADVAPRIASLTTAIRFIGSPARTPSWMTPRRPAVKVPACATCPGS